MTVNLLSSRTTMCFLNQSWKVLIE